MTDEIDLKHRRRWRDDVRILQIVTAPDGWWALYQKDPADVERSDPPSIYDFAWVEPVAMFALLEEVERLELLYGEDEWKPAPVTSDDESHSWPHTRVVPLAWHSGEGHFPGADELRGFRQPWDYIVTPPVTLTASWLVEKFAGYYTEAAP